MSTSFILLAIPICVVAAEVELSAPVRVLGGPPAAEPVNRQMRPAPAPPRTLVRGLMPQYQSSRAFRSDVATAPDLEHPAMRFLLALPDRLLLLEANVTIDGQPYEVIREQRIDRLLAELKKPAPAEPEPVSKEDTTDALAGENTDATPPEADTDEPPSQDEPTAESPADEEPADKEGEEAEAESEPEVPLIPVPSDALEARLRRYATVTGRPPTRDEVRWLLTKWVDGPTLLLLDENFQRFRATQAPAFQVLDRDMDGNVSAEELKAAQQTLLSCDVNQNDVVEYTEIAEVADDPRRQSPAAPVQALVPLFDQSFVARAFRRLAKRYAMPESTARFDGNSDGEIDASEFAKLAEAEPDLVLTVSFDSTDPAKSTTTITQLASDLDDELARNLGPSITIPAGETMLEVSAVQSSSLSGSDQISVGTVNDGYPLLPAIDPNEDGRLTIRELRSVLDHLQRFDVNKDGAISAAEIPSTVRVSFGLGPSVHEHLADIRSVHPPATVPDVAVPDWFTQMDGNKDGDISPREFLLGPEQFKKVDTDKDGLISPTEAVESTKDKSPTAKQQPKPEAKPEEAEATP